MLSPSAACCAPCMRNRCQYAERRAATLFLYARVGVFMPARVVRGLWPSRPHNESVWRCCPHQLRAPGFNCHEAAHDILVPTADIGVARVANAASRLMLPAFLRHCPLTDLLAAAATANFRNATVRWWLGGHVDQRATAMVFQVGLDRCFPCPAQGNLSRAQQGSHRSRIHGQKRASTAGKRQEELEPMCQW